MVNCFPIKSVFLESNLFSADKRYIITDFKLINCSENTKKQNICTHVELTIRYVDYANDDKLKDTKVTGTKIIKIKQSNKSWLLNDRHFEPDCIITLTDVESIIDTRNLALGANNSKFNTFYYTCPDDNDPKKKLRKIPGTLYINKARDRCVYKPNPVKSSTIPTP